MSEVVEKKKSAIEYFNGDEMAAKAWQDKYAIEGEINPDDMHKRMAKEFARIELKYAESDFIIFGDRNFNINSLSEYGQNRIDTLSEKDIYQFFKDFKYIVPQGSIMSQLGAPNIGSLSNCFVIGQPEDSYGGIFQKDQQMAQLMKRRGGVGLDISTLRPVGVATSNAAKSSTGAVSFMNRFSNTTREVAQNGRRGALMLTIDVRHPDVLDFINIKKDKTKVTGANISVMLRDDFMEAVKNDGDYFLKFPCNTEGFFGGSYEDFPYNTLVEYGKIRVKRVKAKEIYDAIVENAHDNAEPGQMFVDHHHDYSPDGVYPQYKGVTTNPCGEIFMQEYDACRLIAVNFFSFVENPFTDEAFFNFEKFYKYNYEAMRLSDDLIDLELEHIDRILDKISEDPETVDTKQDEYDLWQNIKKTAQASRRTGLGFTALGDMLAALNLGYDSKEGLDIIDAVMHTKMESELDCTIDLAILRGTFEGWDSNLEFNGKYSSNFYKFIMDKFPDQALKMAKYGRRNVSFSTIAPTGTVSLMTQTTSGLEPLFAPFYTRKKKVNPNDKDVRIDFTDANGDNWQEYAILHPKFKDWINSKMVFNTSMTPPNCADDLTKEALQSAFEQSPWYGSTANDIDWIQRIRIQGVLQKYITHSISSTINLPKDVTKEEVSEIYLAAYEEGLKGVTIYRDGCRDGVLVTEPSVKVGAGFNYKDAPKRPKCLTTEIHTTTSKGVKWNVLVGLYDGKPYEVMAVKHFTNETELELCKVKKGRYDLLKNGETYSEDVTAQMDDDEEIISRLVSTALRHSADITFVVEQLNKTNGDITSFGKAISRVLKKYISEEKYLSRAICNDCGSDDLRMEEGCSKCNSCGSSKCG